MYLFFIYRKISPVSTQTEKKKSAAGCPRHSSQKTRFLPDPIDNLLSTEEVSDESGVQYRLFLRLPIQIRPQLDLACEPVECASFHSQDVSHVDHFDLPGNLLDHRHIDLGPHERKLFGPDRIQVCLTLKIYIFQDFGHSVVRESVIFVRIGCLEIHYVRLKSIQCGFHALLYFLFLGSEDAARVRKVPLIPTHS